MARVKIYKNPIPNTAAAHHVKTRAAVKHHTEKIQRKAERLLANARASSKTHKYFGPDGLTDIEVEYVDVDAFVFMEAPNAMAIEFGHQPSGVFKGTNTDAPEGLYIITRAGLG